MTCPGCKRDVTLIGGYCGLCSSEISGAVNEAIDDVEALDDTASVVDVARHSDGHLHVRIKKGGDDDAE